MDATVAALPPGASWWELVVRRAELTPDRIMLEDEHARTLTFAEYRDAAEEVAAGLVAQGVEPGHVVSWQLPTSIEAAVLMSALARLDVTQNPIIPILRRAEVGLIVEQVESDWLVVPGTRRGFDHAAMARDVARGRDCRLLVCDELGVAPGEIALPTEDLRGLDPSADHADGVRWLYYTSGTTAVPKGAKHTDRSVLASSVGLVDRAGLCADDVFPVAFPLTHIGGVMFLGAQLRVGARLVLLEAFDPVASPILMAERGATILGSAAPFFHAYLAAQERGGPEPLFPRLRACVAGGAPLPPGLHAAMRERLGQGVLNAWGMTEFGQATMLALDDPDEQFLYSVGRPVAGVEVRVVDLAGVEAPVGVEGELRLRGPQCFTGFVDASLDADVFDEDGFFRTGDLGVVDADGFVRVTGRLKDIIIRNAENISAPEVEGVLVTHPAIAEVAVIGLPDDRTGERCCAAVALADGAGGLTLDDVAAHCRAHGLANQKIPEQLEIVADLPRHPMGKVLKHELRAQLRGASR